MEKRKASSWQCRMCGKTNDGSTYKCECGYDRTKDLVQLPVFFQTTTRTAANQADKTPPENKKQGSLLSKPIIIVAACVLIGFISVYVQTVNADKKADVSNYETVETASGTAKPILLSDEEIPSSAEDKKTQETETEIKTEAETETEPETEAPETETMAPDNETTAPETETMVTQEAYSVSFSESHSPDDGVSSVNITKWNDATDLGIDGRRYTGGLKIQFSNMFTDFGSSVENAITSRIVITRDDGKPFVNDSYYGIFVLDKSMYGSSSHGTIKILLDGKKEVFTTGEISGNTVSAKPFNVPIEYANSIIVEASVKLIGSSFTFGMVTEELLQ